MSNSIASPRFDVVQRSVISGTIGSKAPLEGLKYYLFICKDGINIGNTINEGDLKFWRTNANMDIIAICDIAYLLSDEHSEPEWKKVLQK